MKKMAQKLIDEQLQKLNDIQTAAPNEFVESYIRMVADVANDPYMSDCEKAEILKDINEFESFETAMQEASNQYAKKDAIEYFNKITGIVGSVISILMA
jgi:vacuolar-type H+-ATPase subunit E/Vma4